MCVCACMIEPQEERGSQSTVRGGESEGGRREVMTVIKV